MTFTPCVFVYSEITGRSDQNGFRYTDESDKKALLKSKLSDLKIDERFYPVSTLGV